jgi:Fe-S-cluster-containing dehydrogenase component
MRYAMAVDTKKCVGCSDCVVACQTENNVPIGYCRDWIVEVTDGTYPQLEIEIRSERCNHCENAPCVRCCPTGASHYSDGGTVLVKKYPLHWLRGLYCILPLRCPLSASRWLCG